MRFPALIIGLTGTFGSGKSTVARIFQRLGAGMITSDAIVHGALRKGGPLYGVVGNLFKEARTGGGQGLDRKKIAKIIFRDARKRKQLEDIIHPYVFERLRSGIGKSRKKVIVLEVPLLFETGFNRFCDRTIVVKSSDSAIYRRLKKKGFSIEEIRARMKAQMPLEKKIRGADIVIDNSKSITVTRYKVRRIWRKLHSSLKGAV
ncbi:MAG: dephospho-CoA kinase [Candidatus Omnitrophica bacterium]|nr:dephospho-CoA kinase [Candidatus Omnitrophota bacterium]